MNNNISVDLQSTIQDISLVDLNIFESRRQLLDKTQQLLKLKLKLNSLKPGSRLSNNPSVSELLDKERKLKIQIDFHDRSISDPIKWVMAITPALLVSIFVGPPLVIAGLAFYIISYFY